MFFKKIHSLLKNLQNDYSFPSAKEQRLVWDKPGTPKGGFKAPASAAAPQELSRYEYYQNFDKVLKHLKSTVKASFRIPQNITKHEARVKLGLRSKNIARMAAGKILAATPRHLKAKMRPLLKRFALNLKKSIDSKLSQNDVLAMISKAGTYTISLDKKGMLAVTDKKTGDFIARDLKPTTVAKPSATTPPAAKPRPVAKPTPNAPETPELKKAKEAAAKLNSGLLGSNLTASVYSSDKLGFHIKITRKNPAAKGITGGLVKFNNKGLPVEITILNPLKRYNRRITKLADIRAKLEQNDPSLKKAPTAVATGPKLNKAEIIKKAELIAKKLEKILGGAPYTCKVDPKVNASGSIYIDIRKNKKPFATISWKKGTKIKFQRFLAPGKPYKTFLTLLNTLAEVKGRVAKLEKYITKLNDLSGTTPTKKMKQKGAVKQGTETALVAKLEKLRLILYKKLSKLLKSKGYKLKMNLPTKGMMGILVYKKGESADFAMVIINPNEKISIIDQNGETVTARGEHSPAQIATNIKRIQRLSDSFDKPQTLLTRKLQKKLGPNYTLVQKYPGATRADIEIKNKKSGKTIATVYLYEKGKTEVYNRGFEKKLAKKVNSINKIAEIVTKLDTKAGTKTAPVVKKAPKSKPAPAAKPKALPAEVLKKRITALKKILGTRYMYLAKPKFGTVELSLKGKQPFAFIQQSPEGDWKIAYKGENGRWVRHAITSSDSGLKDIVKQLEANSLLREKARKFAENLKKQPGANKYTIVYKGVPSRWGGEISSIIEVQGAEKSNLTQIHVTKTKVVAHFRPAYEPKKTKAIRLASSVIPWINRMGKETKKATVEEKKLVGVRRKLIPFRKELIKIIGPQYKYIMRPKYKTIEVVNKEGKIVTVLQRNSKGKVYIYYFTPNRQWKIYAKNLRMSEVKSKVASLAKNKDLLNKAHETIRRLNSGLLGPNYEAYISYPEINKKGEVDIMFNRKGESNSFASIYWKPGSKKFTFSIYKGGNRQTVAPHPTKLEDIKGRLEKADMAGLSLDKQSAIKMAYNQTAQLRKFDKKNKYDFAVNREETDKNSLHISVKKDGVLLGYIHTKNPTSKNKNIVFRGYKEGKLMQRVINLRGPAETVLAVQAFEKYAEKRKATIKTTPDRITEEVKLSGNQLTKALLAFRNPSLTDGPNAKVKLKTITAGGKSGIEIDFKSRRAMIDTTLQDIFSGLKGKKAYIRVNIINTKNNLPSYKNAFYDVQNNRFTTAQGKLGKEVQISYKTQIFVLAMNSRAPKTRIGTTVLAPEIQLKAAHQRDIAKEKAEYAKWRKKQLNLMKSNDDTLLMNFEDAILNNRDIIVPKFLRHDADFRKNWGHISRFLGRSLQLKPFNLTTALKRRTYIQNVIQERDNAYIHAKDFFTFRINGKPLYESNLTLDGKPEQGFNAFKKDYQFLLTYFAQNKVNPYDKEQMKKICKTRPDIKAMYEEWNRLQGILKGIARVLDAITRMEKFNRQPLSANDKYRSLLIRVPLANAAERKEGIAKGYSNYRLDGLLHKKEGAPHDVLIGASSKVFAQIQTNTADFRKKHPTINKYFKGVGQRKGMKALFMLFGFKKLLREGYIKKQNGKENSNQYLLVKSPSKAEWEKCFRTIMYRTGLKRMPKLWDDRPENFKQWEQIRATIDDSQRSRQFISKVFGMRWTREQNLNWWQKWKLRKSKWKFWQTRNKQQGLGMAYISDPTLTRKQYLKDYENFITSEVGQINFVRQTQKKVAGTEFYAVDPEEVAKKTRTYLWMSIWQKLSFGAAEGKFGDTVKKVAKSLGIPMSTFNSVDATNQANSKSQMAVFKLMYAAAAKKFKSGKRIDAARLTPGYIKHIQDGFVLARQQQMRGNFDSFVESLKNLDPDPMYRKMQIDAYKKGCPIHLLPQVAQRVKFGLIAYFNGEYEKTKTPGFLKLKKIGGGGGVAVYVSAAKWDGGEFGVGAAITAGRSLTGGAELNLSAGAHLRFFSKNKQAHLHIFAGATLDVLSLKTFAGLSLMGSKRISSEWDAYGGVNLGVGFDATKAQATLGIGATVGVKWNQRRTERLAREKATAIRKVSGINGLIEKGNLSKAAEAIKKHPIFGEWFKAYQVKIEGLLKKPMHPRSIVDLYTRKKDHWENMANRNIKVPAVVGAGLTFMIFPPWVIPSITVDTTGGKVVYTVRAEHSLYNEHNQRRIQEDAIRKKLAKNHAGALVVKGWTLQGHSGLAMYSPSREGTNVTMDKTRKAEVPDMSKTQFGIIKQRFASIDIHVKKVALPGVKGTFLEITPLRTEGSSVEFLMPNNLSKALILDKKKNRVILAASALKKLYITRARIELPDRGHGDAVTKEVITFKSNIHKTDSEIRDTAPTIIYKLRDQKYRVVEGLKRTGAEDYEGNIMSLSEFKQKLKGHPPYSLQEGYRVFAIVWKKNKPNVKPWSFAKWKKWYKQNFRHHYMRFNMKTGLYENYKFERLGDVAFAERIKKEQDASKVMYKQLAFETREKTIPNVKQLNEFANTWYRGNKPYFDRKIGSIRLKHGDLRHELSVQKVLFDKLRVDYKAKYNKDISEQQLNVLYAFVVNRSFVTWKSPERHKIQKNLDDRNRVFKQYMKIVINKFKSKHPDLWAKIEKNAQKVDPSFRLTTEMLAQKFMESMPQKVSQILAWDKNPKMKRRMTRATKFASYSHKKNALRNLVSAYGHANGNPLNSIFTLFNPETYDPQSRDPRIRAAGQLILNILSPLSVKGLKKAPNQSPNKAAEFLKSDLPKLLLSQRDPKYGINPVARILTLGKFQGLTRIYAAIKNKTDKTNPTAWAKVLKDNAKSFNLFKEFVMAVRNEQLNGTPIDKNGTKEVVFNGLRVRMNTTMMAGGYNKCSNGTIAIEQSFKFEFKSATRVKWAATKDTRRAGVTYKQGRYVDKTSAAIAAGGRLRKRPARKGQRMGSRGGRTPRKPGTIPSSTNRKPNKPASDNEI